MIILEKPNMQLTPLGIMHTPNDMKITLYTSDTEGMIFGNTYPSKFRSTQNHRITERAFSTIIMEGEGSYCKIFIEDIHIEFSDIKKGIKALFGMPIIKFWSVAKIVKLIPYY